MNILNLKKEQAIPGIKCKARSRWEWSQDKAQAGFSFVEVLVFVTIISFLFISLTATVTSSLRKMQTAESRLYAQNYAGTLLEWLRAEKEADWEAFVARDVSGSGTLYCFNQKLDFREPITNWSSFDPGATCRDVDLSNGDSQGFDGIWRIENNATVAADLTVPRIFRRYAIITRSNAPTSKMTIQIVVEWRDGDQYFTVPLNTVFTRYNEN